MKKALVLSFNKNFFEKENLDKLTADDDRLNAALDGMENGTCDIQTIEDFLSDINNGIDNLALWYCYVHYVDESDYNDWAKYEEIFN